MKFSKGERKIDFAADNYFPAPGHYLGNDKRYTETIKAVMNGPNVSDTAPTFTRQPRFQQKQVVSKVLPGPGTYDMKSGFYLDPKKQQHYEQIQQLKSKESQSLFQVNAIPSIPSGHGTAGYQEIGEGLLILMKDNRKDYKEEVGPGSYNLSQAAIKPKMPAFSIPKNKPIEKKADQPASIDVMLVSQTNPPAISSNRNTKSQEGGIQIGIGGGIVVEKQFTNKQLQKKVRAKQNMKDVEMLVKQANRRRVPPGQFNLQLLVLREKMLARGNQVPPPGYYFDPKKASTFKIQDLQPEMQCFNSSVHRFQDAPNENPGPGQYEVFHVSDINPIGNGIRFGTGPQGLNLVNGLGGIPGPGNYEIKDCLDGLEPQQNKASHQAVFGSGAMRFSDHPSISTISENIGPGSYNIPGGFKKKRQKTRTVVVQQYEEAQQLKLKAKEKPAEFESFNQRDEELTDTTSQSHFSHFNNTKDENFGEGMRVGGNQQGNSVFESKIPRFRDGKGQLDMIGPGSYNTQTPVVPDTFNKGADLFAQSERKFGLQENKPSVPKRIGPGFYEPNIDPTRQKQTRNIVFK